MGHRTLIEITDTNGHRYLYYAHWGSPHRVYGALAAWLADADLSKGKYGAWNLPQAAQDDSGLEIEIDETDATGLGMLKIITQALAEPDRTEFASVYQIHIDTKNETATITARHRRPGQPWSEPDVDHATPPRRPDRAKRTVDLRSVHQRAADHHAAAIAAILGQYGPQDPETWTGKQLAHHQRRHQHHREKAARHADEGDPRRPPPPST